MEEQQNKAEGWQASLFQAAQYVRMSTEHQQYSTENQADKIREYADRRGIQIIKTYADEGKSGLRIDGRQALQQLIWDVESAFKRNFKSSLFTTLAVGDAFRTLTNPLITEYLSSCWHPGCLLCGTV